MDESGLKLSELLPLSRQDVDPLLRDCLAGAPLRTKLGASLLSFAGDVIAERLGEALDIDVFELLASAWAAAVELHEYSDPRRHPPEEVSIVHLGEHEITAVEEPVLQIRIGKLPPTELKLALELSARFKGAELSIQAGRVRSVAPGDCSAAVKLKYKSVLLKEKATPGLRLPGKLRLGAGIPIPGRLFGREKTLHPIHEGARLG